MFIALCSCDVFLSKTVYSHSAFLQLGAGLSKGDGCRGKKIIKVYIYDLSQLLCWATHLTL